MDERIFPGITEQGDRIIQACKKYLGVESIEGKSKSREVVVCRALAIVLIQEYNRSLTFIEVGKIINRDHSMISHINKYYRPLFDGEVDYYHFIYLNVKAMLDYKPHIKLRDIFTDAVLEFPISESEKKEGIGLIKSEPSPMKTHNRAVRAIVVYLVRNSVSVKEIRILLNLTSGFTTPGKSIKDEKQYFKVIDKVLKQKIKILTNH